MRAVVVFVAKALGVLLLYAQTPLATNTGVPLTLEAGGLVWCEGGWQNLPSGTFANSGTVYISGDIQNDDPGQFFLLTPLPGTLVLNGNQQVLSGQHPIRTDTVRLLGTAPKILLTPLYIDQVLDLGAAELRTQTTFAAVRNPDPNAIVRTSGFVSSDPGGYLERLTDRSTDYLFPVGGHTPLRYRPVYITPTTAALHRWAVRLANTDPNNENLPRSQRHPDLCEINPLYYHYINRLSGNDPAHLICVYDPSDPIKGALAQWRTPAGRWEPTGAAPGPFPNSWQVLNVSSFDAPNWAFSAPALVVTISASADTVEPGQPVSFTATTTPPGTSVTYTWQLGDGTTSTALPPITHVYTNAGIYSVIVTAQSSEGCLDTASLRIVVNVLSGIFIPNAFSPNQDGSNDEWRPTIYGVRSVRWVIFDRWGIEVARGEGTNISWNGTTRGQPCPEGVYTFLIEIEHLNGQKEQRAGTITLLR